MKLKITYLVIIVVLVVGATIYLMGYLMSQKAEKPTGQTGSQEEPAEQAQNQMDNKISNQNQEVSKTMKHLITIKTNLGDIQFETYDADAPKTVENFISLANKGFYNGLIFHRVIKGFMIQGGDPNCSSPSGSGMCGAGGPGYQFEDELNPETASYQAGYQKGVVAMANAGPNTNGSQFFIMLENNSLPHNYTIFGKVLKGQDVVDKIGDVETNSGDKPLTPIVIEEVATEES